MSNFALFVDVVAKKREYAFHNDILYLPNAAINRALIMKHGLPLNLKSGGYCGYALEYEMWGEFPVEIAAGSNFLQESERLKVAVQRARRSLGVVDNYPALRDQIQKEITLMEEARFARMSQQLQKERKG